MNPEQERKLDRFLGLLDKFEAVFGSPPTPEADPKELAAVEAALAKGLEAEPSPDDLLFWSTPGPLPSEVAAAEAEPEEGAE